MTTYQTAVKNICSDIITELQCLSDDCKPSAGYSEEEQLTEARKEVLTKLLKITLSKLQSI